MDKQELLDILRESLKIKVEKFSAGEYPLDYKLKISILFDGEKITSDYEYIRESM